MWHASPSGKLYLTNTDWPHGSASWLRTHFLSSLCAHAVHLGCWASQGLLTWERKCLYRYTFKWRNPESSRNHCKREKGESHNGMRLPQVLAQGSNTTSGVGQSSILRSLSGATWFLLGLLRSYLLLTTSNVPQTLISLPVFSLWPSQQPCRGVRLLFPFCRQESDIKRG